MVNINLSAQLNITTITTKQYYNLIVNVFAIQLHNWHQRDLSTD